MSHFNFNADIEAMRTKNERLKTIANTLENNVNEVIRAANNVSVGWTGKNSDSYVESFNNFKPTMDENVSKIKATTKAIDDTIQIISDVQQKNAAGIQKLTQ